MTNEKGETFFVGKDVAEALGYKNPQKALRDHVDEEDKTLNVSFTVNGTAPIIINSGYRSEAVNKAVGGVKGSNHLTGCAVDIRCLGIEQALRYAALLLDISDLNNEDYDELLIEQKGLTYWIHFAVRPSDNRRRTNFKR